MENEQEWIRAVEQTWVVRYPKQHLATFGSRDTLSQLHIRERRTKAEALQTSHAARGTVH